MLGLDPRILDILNQAQAGFYHGQGRGHWHGCPYIYTLPFLCRGK